MEKEKNRKKIKSISSNLIEAGVVVSGIGAVTIVEGIALQRGELGSVGALIGGTGAVLIFTGIRAKKS